MNTNQTLCPENLKAKLGALVSEAPLGPHAIKTVTRIKDQLIKLGISSEDIEQIETI